jgi:hypothetical protein
MLLSLMIGAGLIAGQPTVPKCKVDIEAMMSLNIHAFDQTEQGWRQLAKIPGCERAAADLIQTYRINVAALLPLLSWHQGQLLALNGDYDEAVPLLEKARDPSTRPSGNGWDDYVDATVAFLKKDAAGIAAAEKRLAARPRPADWPADQEWPMNFKIVQSLGRCIGRPYSEAYSDDCGLKK